MHTCACAHLRKLPSAKTPRTQACALLYGVGNCPACAYTAMRYPSPLSLSMHTSHCHPALYSYLYRTHWPVHVLLSICSGLYCSELGACPRRVNSRSPPSLFCFPSRAELSAHRRRSVVHSLRMLPLYAPGMWKIRCKIKTDTQNRRGYKQATRWAWGVPGG